MSKYILFFLLLPLLLLAGCGTGDSWEDEKVSEVSQPLLSEEVKISWNVEGKDIQIKVTNDNGKPIDKFELNHEKLLHLIIVSKDLSYFNHIHPEYKGKGVFKIHNDFPMGGDYRMIADFRPTGGNSMSKMTWVRVDGSSSQPIPVTVDKGLEKSVDDKKVSLSADSFETGNDMTLKFTLIDEKTNQPITDLQPYLGAIGHVVVLSEDGEQYLHVHATEGQGSGPEALFETEFPKSGVYKIWAQFQRDNKVFTVSYVVNVQ